MKEMIDAVPVDAVKSLSEVDFEAHARRHFFKVNASDEVMAEKNVA